MPDRAGMRRLLALFLGAFFVYALTAGYGPLSKDPLANTRTAWSVATRGSIDLADLPGVALRYSDGDGSSIWYLSTDRGVVSKYPPGAPSFAVPVFLVGRIFDPALDARPAVWPAAVAASLATAMAVCAMYLCFLRVTTDRKAMIAALISAFATPMWSVSSDALWQHGPEQLWLGMALLGMATARAGLAGWSFALAIVTRPITALATAVVGVSEALYARRLRTLLRFGYPAVVGAAALAAYNLYAFQTLSPTGGYGRYPVTGLVNNGFADWVRNVGGALFSPERGVLIVTPFIILLLPGLVSAWRASPSWVRSAAIGGALMFLVQLRVNRYSGGDAFWGYRVQLGAMTLFSPLLIKAYTSVIEGHTARTRAFRVLVAVALGYQIAGSVFYSPPLL